MRENTIQFNSNLHSAFYNTYCFKAEMYIEKCS